MLNYQRYRRVPVVSYPERKWPNKEIEKAPVWCSAVSYTHLDVYKRQS